LTARKGWMLMGLSTAQSGNSFGRSDEKTNPKENGWSHVE
jgi:hypothetical protein